MAYKYSSHQNNPVLPHVCYDIHDENLCMNQINDALHPIIFYTKQKLRYKNRRNFA